MKTISCFIFFLFISFQALAQPGIFDQFLISVPSSAEAAGMGGAGVTGNFSGISAFYYNPAFSAGEFGKITAGYQRTNYFLDRGPYSDPDNLPMPGFNSFNLSMDIGTKIINFPLVVGLSYINSEVSHPLFINHERLREDLPKGENYSGFNISLKTRLFVTIALGATFKDYAIAPTHYSSEGYYGEEENHKMTDYGINITVPIEEYNHISGRTKFNNSFDLSLGYSLCNESNDILFYRYYHNLRTPKVARLGYSIMASSNLEYKKMSINLLDIQYSVNAEDILYNYYYGRGFESYYESQELLGDIKFYENLLLGKGDTDVIIRKGFRLKAAETITLMTGVIMATVLLINQPGVLEYQPADCLRAPPWLPVPKSLILFPIILSLSIIFLVSVPLMVKSLLNQLISD